MNYLPYMNYTQVNDTSDSYIVITIIVNVTLA